jgi:hypothetical protein
MINHTEAIDEAQFLTKQSGREVKAVAVHEALINPEGRQSSNPRDYDCCAYRSKSGKTTCGALRYYHDQIVKRHKFVEPHKDHGVKIGFYSNLPGPNQTAWIECLCGEEVSGQTSSWEDAGREMDLHLEGVRQAQ